MRTCYHPAVVLGLATAAVRIGFTAAEDPDEPPLEIPVEPDNPLADADLIQAQFTADPYEGQDVLQMIIDGTLHIASLAIDPYSFAGTDTDPYKVTAEFCAYNPLANKDEAAGGTTTNDLMSLSTHCGEHAYDLDLATVVQAVREADADTASSTVSLHPDGLIFAEPLSGSKIIGKAIAHAFSSTLVVSENSALTKALAACDTLINRYSGDGIPPPPCSPEKQGKLVADIVYLLGRTKDPAITSFYLKLAGESSYYMPNMTNLYNPTIRRRAQNACGESWLFTYRSAQTALAKMTASRPRTVKCLKSASNPSKALKQKAEADNIALKSLSMEDLCATYLAAMVDTAAAEYVKTPGGGGRHLEGNTGLLVNYDAYLAGESSAVVANIMEVIFPHLNLQDDIDATGVELVQTRVTEVMTKHSSTGTEWTGETVEVSPAVAAAAVTLDNAMSAIGRL